MRVLLQNTEYVCNTGDISNDGDMYKETLHDYVMLPPEAMSRLLLNGNDLYVCI